MFEVTEKWIESCKTSNGGFTRIQVESLGFGWPPVKGWKKKAVGKMISLDDKKIFESKYGLDQMDLF